MRETYLGFDIGFVDLAVRQFRGRKVAGDFVVDDGDFNPIVLGGGSKVSRMRDVALGGRRREGRTEIRRAGAASVEGGRIRYRGHNRGKRQERDAQKGRKMHDYDGSCGIRNTQVGVVGDDV